MRLKKGLISLGFDFYEIARNQVIQVARRKGYSSFLTLKVNIFRIISYTSFAALAIATASLPSHSHSGGLNSAGCHAGSQPYHCHRPQRQPVRRAPSTTPTPVRSTPTRIYSPPAATTEIPPAWSAPNNQSAGYVCITDGPTNIRTSPNALDSSIRATLRTGSCGQTVAGLYEDGYFLVDFWINEISENRRYWVHESQI